jgi:hypothetical protein
LFVESFTGVDADDDVPAQAADEESVGEEVGGVGSEGVGERGSFLGRRRGRREVVGFRAGDFNPNGLSSKVSTRAAEFKRNVRSVRFEDNDLCELFREFFKRDSFLVVLFGRGKRPYVRLDTLGDCAVVERVGKEGICVCFGEDGG